MWSSLWTSLGRRARFWLKLLCVSSIGHVFFFFLLFFVYRGQHAVLEVNINRSILKSGAPIIFMPFSKTAPRAKMVPKKTAIKKAMPKKTAPKKIAPKTLRQAPADAKAMVDRQDERVTKKQVPAKRTTITKKKTVVKKPVVKKTPVKKKPIVKKIPVKKPMIKKKPSAKKTPAKKLLAKKKPTVKKPEIKKPLVKKKSPVKKIPEKKPVVKKIVKDRPVVTEQVLPEKAAGVAPEITCNGQQPIYIGQQELESFSVQYKIEQEVIKHWRPPPGISKDLTCTINVMVDWNGKPKKVVVSKSSGVLIYDISARTAIPKMNFPKGMRGKELNITFNQ